MIGGIWAGHIGGGESGLLLVFESLTSNDMTYLEYLLFHFFILFPTVYIWNSSFRIAA